MIEILYFHGFASSPGSRKVGLLRDRLPEDEFHLNVPDMNVPSFAELDWRAMVANAVDEGRRRPPDLIVGSSLGSLLTLEVAHAGIAAPIVMIAPALGVARRWSEALPDDDPIHVYNHVLDREVPIHRRFFEQMSTLEIDLAPPPVPVTVIMGRLDESVPFAIVSETWERWVESGELVEGSRFVEVPDGDHSLTENGDLIAEEIRRVSGGS
jgi:predicted esterase YcpF (UPF0227 family)